MSSISFTMGDWHKVCAHFKLDMSEVLSVLTSSQRRSLAPARSASVRASVTAVSDTDSEAEMAASVVPVSDNFATSKTRAFAASHGISADSLTGSGNKGKITMEDVKKALPRKKRGRKPKPKATAVLDTVDALPAEAAAKPVKAKKDPNKPKGPSGVWMQFLNSKRQEFRDAHPDAKMTEITAMISTAYKALTEAEKEPFVKLADADKVRYAAAMASYTPPVDTAPSGKKAKKAKKDPNKPKRALSMWMLWLNANRQRFRDENPGKSMPEITKIASVAYKLLTEAEKEPWLAKVAQDKERYAAAMASYSPAAAAEAPKADKADKAFAKLTAKAAKVQTKVDGIVEEILSYVALNKLDASAEKALRNRVKDVDEHCAGSLTDGVTLKEMKTILKEQKALHRQLAKKSPKATKATKAGGGGGAEAVTFDDAVAVEFDDFDLNASDSDDDELDEEAEQFEYQGSTYWKTWEGFVMDEPDGPKVGRWDAEDEVIVFDE